MKCFKGAVKFLVLFLLLVPPAFARPYQLFPAAVHIQSRISDGKYSIEELAELAQRHSVKILVISDTFLRRWEYGLWPLRNLIKKSVEENSVMRIGPGNYLARIRKAQEKNPGVLIIPAIEVAPFYYWKINLVKDRGLALHNWHKKLLVAGLPGEKDYRLLPAAGNYSSRPLHKKDLIRFWPLLLILPGVLALRRRKKGAAYILATLAALFLLNNLKFPISPYDSYHGEKGIKPYQYLVDYVNQKGGVVFWLHPEANYTRRVSGVKIWTTPYKDDLLHGLDYTGFSGMYHDIITVTQPGDLWDQILTEYCQRKRERPIWILGEVGFDGVSRDELTSIQTVFMLGRLDREEVLEALKRGKMYAQLNLQKNNLSLEKFTVSDADHKTVGFMGDEISISGMPRIEVMLNNSSHPQDKLIVRLIRQGGIIREEEVEGPRIDWVFTDQGCPNGEKTFYRLEIEGNFCKLQTNPIFVKTR